jgi:hypothetical protein
VPSVFSREFVEQGPGLLQVGGIKALAEPAVDRRQQLVGLSALALALPQPTQTHSGAQLPGFGLLAAGNGEGLLEAFFCSQCRIPPSEAARWAVSPTCGHSVGARIPASEDRSNYFYRVRTCGYGKIRLSTVSRGISYGVLSRQ